MFDDDNSNTVDYKELIIGLETFIDISIQDKIKIFIELADVNSDSKIKESELYSVFKQNIQCSDDKLKLKRILQDIYFQHDKTKLKYIEKDKLTNILINSQSLRVSLGKCIRSVKSVD